jgi:hypothetical protein
MVERTETHGADGVAEPADGDPLVILLDIDPWRLMVFWRLPEDRIDSAACLRIVEAGVPPSPRSRLDLPISGAFGRMTVHAWNPGARYEARIGALGPNGLFRPFLASPPVAPPPPPSDAEYRAAVGRGHWGRPLFSETAPGRR